MRKPYDWKKYNRGRVDRESYQRWERRRKTFDRIATLGCVAVMTALLGGACWFMYLCLREALR